MGAWTAPQYNTNYCPFWGSIWTNYLYSFVRSVFRLKNSCYQPIKYGGMSNWINPNNIVQPHCYTSQFGLCLEFSRSMDGENKYIQQSWQVVLGCVSITVQRIWTIFTQDSKRSTVDYGKVERGGGPLCYYIESFVRRCHNTRSEGNCTVQQVCLCVALVYVCRQVATAAPAAPAKQSPHKQLRGRQSMPTISNGNIIYVCSWTIVLYWLLRTNARCNI